MNKIIILLLGLAIGQITFAQPTYTFVLQDSKTKEALMGATVYLPALKIGASTDSSGVVILKNIPDGKFKVVCTHVGYTKQDQEISFPLMQDTPIVILLKKESSELSEIIVSSTRTNSRIEDIPIRVEVIAGEELKEKDEMRPSNISMLLSEATGIQPQQTSAVSGNVSIRLLGLDGKYTQILKDGFPLFSGFSQGLSIMQIPPMDLKQVEVIKGSSSSLYGSDAIAGIINLITKEPKQKRELSFLLNQTSLLGSDVNGYYSQRWKNFGISILSTNSIQLARDVNKDGFSDLPLTKSFTFNPKLFYWFNDKTKLQFGINSNFDTRKGGDMQVLQNKASSLHQFFEENKSSRISTQLKFEKQFANSQQFTFKNSVGYFNRGITQNTSAFEGQQVSTYSEAAYNFKTGKHGWVAGMNVYTDKFSEDSSKSHLQRNYNFVTTGLFFQDDWKPINKLAVQAGIRADYQNQYGWFLLPRLSLMYKLTNNFYVRTGAGMGYKTPSIFSTASEEEGINTIQPIASGIIAEKSVGGNLDFNYKKRWGKEISLNLNQSFFVTQINNPIVLEGTAFVNKPDPIITKGFETALNFRWEELKIFMGYTFVDARRKYNLTQTIVPLTPKHKLVTTVVYEKEEDWTIGWEGFYTSSMYRDLDTDTKPYFIMGLVIQKHFKHFSIIANCENITDVRQTRYENIIIPPTTTPSFQQIYAPLDGRVFNIALRIKI